jgi:hypothetical protein
MKEYQNCEFYTSDWTTEANQEIPPFAYHLSRQILRYSWKINEGGEET